MKITSVETFLVPHMFLFVRVETDEGLVGWGEPLLEGRADVVRAAVHALAERLVGADPLRIEDHWQVMTRGGFYRGGPILSSAVAGLDQALWDIAGKAYGAPVHALLGGPVRDRVRMYAWARGEAPDELAASAREAVAAGYTAVKMGPVRAQRFVETPAAVEVVLARVAAVREAIGPRVDLALDLHGRVSVPMARRLLPLLEPFSPLFVEEPLRPELSDQIGRLVAHSPVPIATGERLFSRTDFRPVLEAGVAVVQPDLSHAGGISEVRRIAAVAEMYDAALAPHCPMGPVALAACLQVDFATPNFLVQEQSLAIERPAEIPFVTDPSLFALDEGHVSVPTAPGLGVSLDEEVLRAADREPHRFRTPMWRTPDGAFAEW